MSIWLLAVLVSSDATALQANFKQGEQLYKEGRVHEALPVFDALLAEPELAPALRTEAQKYQAFALYLMQLFPEAKESWLKLLRLNPGYELDPMWVSPELHAFFGRIKPPEAPPALVETTTIQPAAAPTTPPPAAAPLLEETVETKRGCGNVLCVVPFGVGQFANGRPVKGAAFAAVEAILIGANVGLYWQRANEFDRLGGLENPDAQRDRLTLQRTALVLFGVTAVAGILDAYLLP